MLKLCSKHKVPDEPSNGESLAWLFLNSREWMHRRVEALRLDQSGATRLHISHDATIRAEYPVVRTTGRIVVFLGAIRKGGLRKFDVSAPDGTPASMLNTAQNTELVVGMLEYLLSPYLSQSHGMTDIIFWNSDDGVCEASLQDGLAAVVESRRSNELVIATMNFVAEMLTRNGDDGNAAILLEALFRQLQDNFLLLAEISDEYLGHRVVLKYSRDDEVPAAARGSSVASRRQAPYDQLPNAIDIELPEFATAGSFHLEIQVPPGLIVTELSLQQYELDSDGRENEIASDTDWSKSERTTAHVTLAAKHSLTFARAQVFVMPANQGLVRFTNITVVTIAAIAALCLVEALFPSTVLNRNANPDSSLTSLILALPAFFLSWMARAPEHTLVAQGTGGSPSSFVLLIAEPLRLRGYGCDPPPTDFSRRSFASSRFVGPLGNPPASVSALFDAIRTSNLYA